MVPLRTRRHFLGIQYTSLPPNLYFIEKEEIVISQKNNKNKYASTAVQGKLLYNERPGI